MIASYNFEVYFVLLTLKIFFLQVSHTSTSLSLSDAVDYPSLYRAIPTDFPAVQASIALLKMLNWSRVAIVGEKTTFGLVCNAMHNSVKVARNWEERFDESKRHANRIEKRDLICN